MRDPRVAREPRLAVRDQRIGQELEVGAVAERDGLRLQRVVGVHRVDLGRRLRGDVRPRARRRATTSSASRSPCSTQPDVVIMNSHAMSGSASSQCSARCARYGARDSRSARIGALAAALEAQAQEAGLADGAARASAAARPGSAQAPRRRGHRRPRRARAVEAQPRCPSRGCRSSFRSNSRSLRISSTSSGMPSPVRQLVNRNGLSPRISFESCAITSRLAPT